MKKCLLRCYNHVPNILMFGYIVVSPQMKRSLIIKKHGIYELPDELPNDLKLRIL